MEVWFIVVVSLCLAALLKALIGAPAKAKSDSDDLRRLPLPPAPNSPFPTISSFLLLRKSFTEVEAGLRSISSKLGPIVTIRISSTPAIFIFSRSIAHKALVENGAVFADRRKPQLADNIITGNQHNINSCGYGEKWRILRRNLTSNVLHSSRVKSFSAARSWTLQILIQSLRDADSPVIVLQNLRYAMFCLLCFMCFGDRLDEKVIREVETVQLKLMLNYTPFQTLSFLPWITKIVLRSRWRLLFDLKKTQYEILMPLIKARKQFLKSRQNDTVPAYVDSLLELELPEDDGNGGVIRRKMEEPEILAACSEFLNGGTDTTGNALQWIMANLVKYQQMQAKLYTEILETVGPDAGEISEEDVAKMKYLKAVVMEGLRRHPPAHLLQPHTVTRDVELEGYRIPNDAVVNVMVAEIGWDPEVWEDPMEFRPERFLGADVDITGSREITMIPFGAGRRICPGMGLAMLHLEYYLANLIWKFEWTQDEAHPVNFAEKHEFTTVMKHPLRARIAARSRPSAGH